MKLSRIVSIVFSIIAFAVIESVLAFCPVPLTSASMCCYYAGPNGTTENRFARSLDGCIADAKYTNSLLLNTQNPSCFVYTNPFATPPYSFPASIIDVQERIQTPLAPSVPNGEWRQDFRHTYIARTILTDRYPALIYDYPCADYSGHLNWVVPPPTVACLVNDMPEIPTNDTCTNSLEDNNGLPSSTSGCPAVPVMTRTLGEPCFRTKLETIGLTSVYRGPTSTIRTTTYNQHLTNVWDWYWMHQWLITDPVQYEACTAKRTAVTAEMSKHGIDYRPARKSRHLTGRAFDASRTVINGMKPARIPRLLASPTACTLAWGGKYKQPDYVHFELNVP